MTQTQQQSAPEQQQAPQAVAGVPRLFVGQVPSDKQESDLLSVFSQFGTVEKVSVVRGPEARSRGCAMVQFERWAEAEAAMEAINGTSPFGGTNTRPLVVNFANPRRSGALHLGNEPAIAPRKLFIGQIAKNTTTTQLLEIFEKFGEIEHTNILESKGLHAGCAFVQYTKWAACEAAISALHDSYVMQGCEHPLVVKFADAKRIDGTPLWAQPKRSSNRGSVGHGGGGSTASPQVPHGMRNSYMQAPHQYNCHHNAYMNGSRGMNGAAGNGNGAPLGYTGNGGDGMGRHTMSISPGSPYMSISGLPGASGFAQHSRRDMLYSSPSSGRRGGLSSTGGSTDSLNIDNNSDACESAGSLQSMQLDGNGYMHPHHPHSHSSMNRGPHMANFQAMAAAGMLQGVAYITHDGHVVNVPMVGMRPVLPHGLKLGHGVGDPSVYAHKLFVGQIPFEATEQDLWHMFSSVGDILELAVLRSGGLSKGCAFLTYATRQQAAAAIATHSGRQVAKNKRLVVKFAEHKSSSAASSNSL